MKKTGTKTISRTLPLGREKLSGFAGLELPKLAQIAVAIIVCTTIIGLSVASDGLFLRELTLATFIISALVLFKVSFASHTKL